MEDTKIMTRIFKPGRGFDCGTGILAMSQMSEDGEVYTKSIRHAFLEIKPTNKLVLSTMKKGLVNANISFIEEDDKIIVLGQDSLTQSVERQMVLKRPMSKGVISPSEVKALPMFKLLLKELLGKPLVENEKIVFSVPASPLDSTFDIVYHTAVIQNVLKDLGFEGRPLNEGQAVSFAELSEDDFTGLLLSFGSGMTNFALTNLADCVSNFSIAKGGDFIDESTALSLGYDPKTERNEVTPNLVTLIKEQGTDLNNFDQSDRIKFGIVAHYRELVRYVVSSMVNHLSTNKSIPRFLKPIPIILAGGTSLAKGLPDMFKKELEIVSNKLPFSISEIRQPKNKEDTLSAVSRGCLLALLSED